MFRQARQRSILANMHMSFHRVSRIMRRSPFFDACMLSSTRPADVGLKKGFSWVVSHSSVDIFRCFTYARAYSCAARCPVNDIKIIQPDVKASASMINSRTRIWKSFNVCWVSGSLFVDVILLSSTGRTNHVSPNVLSWEFPHKTFYIISMCQFETSCAAMSKSHLE